MGNLNFVLEKSWKSYEIYVTADCRLPITIDVICVDIVDMSMHFRHPYIGILYTCASPWRKELMMHMDGVME